ncbi:hypothetical protein [uncultured Propionibacterium sp.]|uniref:hypothetical protein n=1 Tax=uncultured Propionibacterium sp. TaxID=218066 RepID=UPI00292EDCFC|nr:hypothetical protein [uncultured Propionibacterium sp.]
MSSTQSLLVAGTGGGAGTTTVTALIIALLRSHGIRTTACDHSNGTLAQRVEQPGRSPQGRVTRRIAGIEEVQVTDAGRMTAAIADALEVPDFALCLVSGAGVGPARTGRAVLDELLGRFGQQIRRRVLVVSSAAASVRRRDEQAAREILRPDVELPRSPVLGAAGPIRLDLAGRALTPVLDRLGGRLGELIRLQAPPQDDYDWPTTAGGQAPRAGAPISEAAPRSVRAGAQPTLIDAPAPVPQPTRIGTQPARTGAQSARGTTEPTRLTARPARAARVAPETAEQWQEQASSAQERPRRMIELH